MNLKTILTPRPTLSDQDVAHGLRMMTYEGIASQAMFSVTSSGILAAFALALGANNLQIGILAAIPFITQPLQILAIFLVEKLRRRKTIALASWIPAQLMWIPMALIPFFVGIPGPKAVALLLGFLAIRGVMAAVTSTAWNSWARDLVPQNVLGSYFSRRMALATVASIIFGLGGAFFVDFWSGRVSPGNEVFGYTYVLLVGAIFLGLATPIFMSQMPEPLMPQISGPQPSLAQTLTTPFRDRNFRQLINFLFFWGLATNLAIPFFTIYMLQRLGFPLTSVIALNTLAQITNVLFVGVWGPFADRFGSKVVLSTSASLYLLVILGWTFTTQPERYFLTVPLVIALQIFAGVAAAGVNLTVGTIGLKLAPPGQATSYLGVTSLAINLGTGLGPLAGGLFADFFSVRTFKVTFEWISPHNMIALPAVNLTGFDFLFGIAFFVGLIALNTLTTIQEEGEVGREVVMAELLAPTRGMARAFGAIPGLRMLTEYPYSYFRRVPGLEVALGVTAYQVASTIRTAVSASNRGRLTAAGIARRVADSVGEIAQQAEELNDWGSEIARHTARGAINAANEVTEDAGVLARGSMIGVLRALASAHAGFEESVSGAAYGAVEGASEAGADIGQVSINVVEGAREVAHELGLSEARAVSHATAGVLAAAVAIGPEAVSQVEAALAEEELDISNQNLEPHNGEYK